MHTTLFPPRRPAGRHGSEARLPVAPAALAEWRSAALRAMFPLSYSRGAAPAALARAVAIHDFLRGAEDYDDLRRRIEEARATLEQSL